MGNQQNMNDQLRVRREKMQELRAEGIDPFGHRFERDSMNQDLHDKYGEMDKDELNGFVFTLNGFQNLFILMKDIYNKQGWQLNNQELPIFFIAGEDDPVIMSTKDWQKAQDFLKEIGYQNVSGKLYSGMRHEILNEKENKMVFEDVLEWIEKK